jgi:hypothetical protein
MNIHSCSYYCHIPACIKAQRDELRDKLAQRTWVRLTDEEKSGFTQHEMAVVKYVSKVLQEKNT